MAEIYMLRRITRRMSFSNDNEETNGDVLQIAMSIVTQAKERRIAEKPDLKAIKIANKKQTLEARIDTKG